MEKEKEEMKRQVWDCGSSLYDSFELRSLQNHLNSAISARTMSMPHLSDRRQPPPTARKNSRISRSLHRLLRSVFRIKKNQNITSTDGSFYVYDTSSTPSTIPEVPDMLPEFDGLSPEMKSLVTRSKSDRFMSTSIGEQTM
ncbi:hypothetical protein E3N88_26996 [Mikania micrantha]|uniref:Uncharacterized protein n=1 Tax=Mikania micrantha TaxID=192012 RepID=A0A5N6MYA4_9ASTR|nr:hypothetical protein E3N88_26996 [Mikania micrantha]